MDVRVEDAHQDSSSGAVRWAAVCGGGGRRAAAGARSGGRDGQEPGPGAGRRGRGGRRRCVRARSRRASGPVRRRRGRARQAGDGVHGHPGEQALEDGVPPGVRSRWRGGVRADGGGDQPGVVGPQGVLDQGQGLRRPGPGGAGRRGRRGVRRRCPAGRAGSGCGRRRGRRQQQPPGRVGVFGGHAGSSVPPRRSAAPTWGAGSAAPARAAAGRGPSRGPRRASVSQARAAPPRRRGARVRSRASVRRCTASRPPPAGRWAGPRALPAALAQESRSARRVRGPAWEWRGSSTTVRPVVAGGARASSTGGKSISPSPKGRCSWTPRRMSSIWTCRSQGAASRTQSAGGAGSRHWQWPMSRVRPSGRPVAEDGAQVVEVGEVDRRWPGSGSTASGMPALVGGLQDGAEGLGEPLPGGVVGGRPAG